MQKIASEFTLQQIRELKQKVPSSDVILELEFTVTNFPSFVHVISKQKRESFSVSIVTSSPECDPSLVHNNLISLYKCSEYSVCYTEKNM